MQIIEATPAERDAAIDIVMEYLEDIDVPEDLATITSEIEGHIRDGIAVVLLARENDRAIGCAIVRAINIDGALELRRLYVRPEARRRGLARSIVRAAQNYARSRGAAWLYLDSKRRLASAVRLYESEGFEHIARYNDEPDIDVYMRKRLL